MYVTKTKVKYLCSVQISALYQLSKRVRKNDLIQNREKAINVLKEGRKEAVSITVLTAFWVSRCNEAAELWVIMHAAYGATVR